MNDTSHEMAGKAREWIMARSGQQRLIIAAQMFDSARTLALASFPSELPEIEIKRRLCERFYDGEVDVEGFIGMLK